MSRRLTGRESWGLCATVGDKADKQYGDIQHGNSDMQNAMGTWCGDNSLSLEVTIEWQHSQRHPFKDKGPGWLHFPLPPFSINTETSAGGSAAHRLPTFLIPSPTPLCSGKLSFSLKFISVPV